MQNKILQFLRRHNEQYVSGEAMSQQLSVTRTTIWKHIQALRTQGYRIESHPRNGYRLLQVPDRLLPAEVTGNLHTMVIGRQAIAYYDTIDSTNNEAKKLAAAGCSEGTLVIAEEQCGGRGRLSRGWFSPSRQGIWFSVVLRPDFFPQEAPKCTLMAAVAVSNAVQAAAGIPCGIKWPNDVLVNGKKLVGILTEMTAEVDKINYIVIGIGINVNIPAGEFLPELRDIATSVAQETGGPVARVPLLQAVLEQLDVLYADIRENGFAATFAAWRAQSVTIGKPVEVFGIQKSFRGVALDIDDEGALLVQTPQGIQRVIAGDVSLRARKMEAGKS